MMSFSPGSRVVLLRAHAGIPAGSVGMVVSSTAVTSIVDFDVDPNRSVLVPNTWLAPAGQRAAAGRQSTFSATRGDKGLEKMCSGEARELVWFTPAVITPGVGQSANFVAVTATPNVLTLLLQGAEVALRGSTTSACWIGSVEFPVVGGPSNLSVDVRGLANQPDGAKTSVFIVIGSVLKSIAFDNARDGEFTDTYQASIGSEPVQTITIIMLAERPAGTDDLLLVVDSLDVVAA